MSSRTSALLLLAVTCLQSVTTVQSLAGLTNYANDFINPNYVLSKNFSSTTIPAQDTILGWANSSSAGGPWSVTTKPYLAPSGNKHDYMSWAPYAWPDCSKVGNTTQLTPQQIWKTCPYITKDGQFNPDNDEIKNSDDFDSLANAVLYNSLAWAIQGYSVYSSRVATFIQAWFLNPDTYMNPNLNYAQMQRGPDGQVGSHTGVLDLKCMAKVVSGVLILRSGNAPEWTTDIDNQFTAWVKEYTTWLTTDDIALKEKAATNNHGTFYVNQLAALQILIGDKQGAQGTVEEYFNNAYMSQIAKNGDQPLESDRTRPYHYRAYNLAAMITNARLAEYIGVLIWNKTTNEGATIQTAVDFAMTTNATSTTEAQELYPDVAAIASTYGDPTNKYTKFLSSKENSRYVTDANFFWNQPLYDSGYAAAMVKTSSASGVTPKQRPTGSQPIQWDPSAPTMSSTSNGARGLATSLGSWPLMTSTLSGAVIFISTALTSFLW